MKSNDVQRHEWEVNRKHKDEKPYISFVVAARNDNHGLDFLQRFQIFLNTLLIQTKKYDLNSELVVVDWNPPTDKPKLSQAISLSHKDNPCKIRIIEVPPNIHKRFQHSDKLPLFQMIAKNVGIRRANGQFVLATNADVLFSDELVRFLASKSLKTNYFYRVDRYDIKKEIPLSSPEKLFDYAKHNVIRINRKDGTFSTTNSIKIWLIKIKIWLIKINQILLLSKEVVLGCSRSLLAHKELRSKAIKFLKRIIFLPYPRLHTNACGDFTVLAKEKWTDLHGYPELEMYSFNIDSVMLQMAYHYGLREKIFKNPMRMYHMEHSSGWTPGQHKNLFRRLQDDGIPVLSFADYESLAAQMKREKRPIIFNKDNWGLGSEILPETCIN